jgi:molybdopterin biosynthesis enzyme
MPTFRHGKNTFFSITDSGSAVRNISDVLKDVSLSRQIDTAETTAFTSTNKSFVIGIPGSSFSCSGMFDLTVDGYLNGIMGLEDARAFVYGPEGNTATRRRVSGSCYLTNLSYSGSVSDMVSFTADFQVTGPVTVDVF